MLLNFSASEAKGLFLLRLAYFLFLYYLIKICSRFRLEGILKPASAGIALIVFTHGVFQKLLIFPKILEQAGLGGSFYARALRARVASGRIYAIFPLPTLYAMVCGLLLIFIIHYLLHARGGERVFWAFLLLIGGANLVLTQSFGGILFFTAGVFFYLFASRVFKIQYLAPLLMLLALVVFLVSALRFSEARNLAPARLRFSNWQQAGRVIASAPLLGVGLGNYEAAVPRHILPGEPASIYAHNFFLQFAAESGLPLSLLLAVLGLPFLRKHLAAFLRPENALFASACVLIFFFNVFDVGGYFFAAGISFAVVFSQVVHSPLRPPPGPFVAAAVLAALLLAGEAGARHQRNADLWLARQDLVRAEAGYRRALALTPFAYRPWLGLAQVSWLKSDLPQAERRYEKVLETVPQQAFANYQLARAAWRRGAYLTGLLHAGLAAEANKKNKEYKRWHEFIKNDLAGRLPLPGN